MKHITDTIVLGIGAKFVSNWEQNILYTKTYQILHRKMISMLTGLKVSSLACRCAFYRREHNAKMGPHRTEFRRS